MNRFKFCYYRLRKFVPRCLQISLRRRGAQFILRRVSGKWPIDPVTSASPEGFPGWPNSKKFALVLRHDVEWQSGMHKCRALAAERGWPLRELTRSHPSLEDVFHRITVRDEDAEQGQS